MLGKMGQIGDSITESSAYFRNAILNDILANETAHDYAPIRSWLAYSGLQPADANSFYRDHGKGIPYGNKGGWSITDAISAGHPEVGVEVGDETTPGDFSWALAMFGTNDIDSGNWNVTTWIATVRSFAEDTIDLGVIPVLSTIPPEGAHLADGHSRSSGVHHATWDGRDAGGRRVATGVYFVALEGKSRREASRTVIVR